MVNESRFGKFLSLRIYVAIRAGRRGHVEIGSFCWKTREESEGQGREGHFSSGPNPS